jgi:hypothetical protein
MDPVVTPDEKVEQKKAVTVAPSVATVPKTGSFKNRFARTSSAFTAEYVIFLIAFGVVLSNLTALVYIFFGLIVDSMNGGYLNAYVPTHLFTLWLMVSSLVALPVTAGLWRRVQGELTLNKEYKGELPKGAAKGFRTFWIVLNGLGIIGMLMAALYAPIVAVISGVGVQEALLSVSLPSFVGIGISVLGLYLATRGAGEGRKVRMWFWVIAGLITLLFAVNYLWGSNLHQNADSRTTRPYSQPSTNYDVYDDLYDDTYYDYDTDYR